MSKFEAHLSLSCDCDKTFVDLSPQWALLLDRWARENWQDDPGVVAGYDQNTQKCLCPEGLVCDEYGQPVPIPPEQAWWFDPGAPEVSAAARGFMWHDRPMVTEGDQLAASTDDGLRSLGCVVSGLRFWSARLETVGCSKQATKWLADQVKRRLQANNCQCDPSEVSLRCHCDGLDGDDGCRVYRAAEFLVTCPEDAEALTPCGTVIDITFALKGDPIIPSGEVTGAVLVSSEEACIDPCPATTETRRARRFVARDVCPVELTVTPQGYLEVCGDVGNPNRCFISIASLTGTASGCCPPLFDLDVSGGPPQIVPAVPSQWPTDPCAAPCKPVLRRIDTGETDDNGDPVYLEPSESGLCVQIVDNGGTVTFSPPINPNTDDLSAIRFEYFCNDSAGCSQIPSPAPVCIVGDKWFGDGWTIPATFPEGFAPSDLIVTKVNGIANSNDPVERVVDEVVPVGANECDAPCPTPVRPQPVTPAAKWPACDDDERTIVVYKLELPALSAEYKPVFSVVSPDPTDHVYAQIVVGDPSMPAPSAASYNYFACDPRHTQLRMQRIGPDHVMGLNARGPYVCCNGRPQPAREWFEFTGRPYAETRVCGGQCMYLVLNLPCPAYAPVVEFTAARVS